MFTKHLDLFTKHLTCLPNTWIYETQAAHSPQGLRLSYFVEHCIYLHRIHASVSSFVRRQVILSIIVRPQRLLYTTRSRELERQRKQLLVWGRVWYVRKVRGGGLRLLWSHSTYITQHNTPTMTTMTTHLLVSPVLAGTPASISSFLYTRFSDFLGRLQPSNITIQEALLESSPRPTMPLHCVSFGF